MLIIPAIDLKDGKCVRLKQGRKDDVTVYSDNPSETAIKWESCGAEVLHIVDLDGAFTGSQKNFSHITDIRKSIRMKIEVGGGIRDIVTVEKLVTIGVDRIIVGTSAIEKSVFLSVACREYPGKIFVGIDAKDGMVAVRGWQKISDIGAKGLAIKMESMGVAGIIYTDISRDGMLSGPNVAAVEEMTNTVKIPVIASGGIATIEDIRSLMKIERLWGAITGKAIYEGTLDLREAIITVKGNG